MRNTIILYHSDCLDGFTGAWVARTHFKNHANYIPIKHQLPPPKGLRGKTIYLIDIVYPPKVMKMLATHNRIIVIDHHASAKKSVAMAHESLYDLSHSGAALAWQYFYPKKRLPKLIRAVEEGDLWQFRSKDTKTLIASLELYDLNFSTWDRLAREFEHPIAYRAHIRIGKIVLEYKEMLIENVARHAEKGVFLGHPAWIVNTPLFDSEVGHKLVSRKGGPQMAVIWRETDGVIRVSLRSTKRVNVAKLAERFGGGGHPQAAGFRIRRSAKLPWRVGTRGNTKLRTLRA